MMLNSLLKLKKKRKTVGRGGARGGTAGKGHKGQKARSGGYVKAQFEGGQTPLTRRIPRRGFNNKNFRNSYVIVSLDKLIDLSKLINSLLITKDVLVEQGILKNTREKVKILMGKKNAVDQSIDKIPLELTIDACSKAVSENILNVGGKVTFA